MHLDRILGRGSLSAPDWLFASLQYSTLMGSKAYNVSSSSSDTDIYGWCVPPYDMVFPAGQIPGFGEARNGVKARFLQFHQEGITYEENLYDIRILSIARYFDLLMDNAPDVIDSLFVPDECVLSCTPLGKRVRERKKDFLHKGAYHRFTGYAHSQWSRAIIKPGTKIYEDIWAFETEHRLPPQIELWDVVQALAGKLTVDSPVYHPLKKLPLLQLSHYHTLFINGLNQTKRFQSIKTHRFDRKCGYHAVRLLLEARQILTTGDLDLRQDSELLNAIRNGECPIADITGLVEENHRLLADLYQTSSLPHSPDQGKIKKLLVDCLEDQYGRGCIAGK